MTEQEVADLYLEKKEKWLQRGYAFVHQHCRGRGKSTGDFVPYINEREDGLALQEWVRKQPFYNGELYLLGSSYSSSVHYCTAPFAPDIKGAVLPVQDSERYNIIYRNGFFNIGLQGRWYASNYKKNSMPEKPYVHDSYLMLPLSDFTKTVFGEEVPSFDETLKHPDKNDPFWQTRFGGGEARGATDHANIPILFTTGYYDLYTRGTFDMWRALDEKTRPQCALLVNPYDHSGLPTSAPIVFENGTIGNTNYMAIAYNSPNKAGAMVAINAILSGEIQLTQYAQLRELPVVDTAKLSSEELDAFNAVNLGKGILSQAELLSHRLPEMPAKLVPIIEQIWLSEVVGK
jgi:predicted acyl esterase